MPYLGVLKRVAPFVLTFAVGLFIASFFVTIALPSSNFPRRGKGREVRQLRFELEQVKRENEDLRRQLEESRSTTDWAPVALPPPVFEADAPPPPPPPRRPHRVLLDK